MKDSLFEILLNLFEQTLTQLAAKHELIQKNDINGEHQADTKLLSKTKIELKLVQSARPSSIRVFSCEEQIKLSKSSYQCLVRMHAWGIITTETRELIISQLCLSSSRFVSLEETKWVIRNALVGGFDAKQLAFLDLVLYHQEDGLSLN